MLHVGEFGGCGDEYARAIVETVRQPLLVLAADLHVQAANGAFYSTFGIPREGMAGRVALEQWSGQRGAAELRRKLSAVFADGVGFEGLEFSREFEGVGVRAMLLSAQPLRGDEAGPPMVLVAMEDITERRRIEQAMEASEVRFRRLFETAQDGILLLEPATAEIIDANPFILAMLGYSRDETVGKRLWELGPFRDVAASRAAFRELQSKQYIRYEDLPLQTKQGSTIDVEFVSNQYRVDGEEIIQCNIRDITDRKRAERELLKLHAELEKRVRERTAELAAANEQLRTEVAQRERVEHRERAALLEERTRIAREIHDTLAQGLTGIVIQLEAAEDALFDEPRATEAHIIRARQLARDSLAEARRSVWALRPQTLADDGLLSAIRQLAEQVGRDAATQIELVHHGRPYPLESDVEDELLRIVQEALTNALRHAKAGRIGISLEFAPSQVELCVQDDGVGYDAAARTEGLGLRGMRERVQRIGGQLVIATRPGQGTRVIVLVAASAPEGASNDKHSPDRGPDRR